MKKIFSAFLLMTMMVASVGSFVSCSDIEESIAAVDEATKNNADAVEALKSEVAALKTALATAQADAAAAKTEANAAKQAAATAKAEAIAAALAEIEKVNGDVDAVNAEIKKINDALAGCATKEAVELLQATIDEYKALIDANGDATTANAEAIAAIEEALAAIGENVTPEQLAEVVAKMNAIDEALVAFQNRLQSVSYVPEWVAGPTAVYFAKENAEYGYVRMSYEVAPAAYASKITAENTKLVGVALKGVEVEEHDVKILSADPETGIVEVLGYIDTESEIWNKADAAVALRVVAEDAQFTSAYTKVNVISRNYTINDAVFFGTYNEDEKFVTNVKNDEGVYQPTALLHEVSYDTAVADSEVALFEGLVARVYVEGFCDYITVEEAAEMFGFEIKVTEKLSSFATKYFVTTVDGFNWVEDEEDEEEPNETPAFIVAKDQTLDITVKFNETVVDSLKEAETLATMYKGKKATAALHANYFQVNGKKVESFAGMTATYKVVGPEQDVELILNNNETINVEWSTENSDGEIIIKDVDVTGGDARAISKGLTLRGKAVDKDGKAITGAPTVDVTFISVDNADVTIDLEWPEEATTYTYVFEESIPGDDDTTINLTFDLTIAVDAAPEQIGEVPASAVTVPLVKSGVEVKADETPWPATNVALTGVVEKLLPYYKEYFESEKKAKAAIETELKNERTVAIRIVDETSGEIAETITGAATYKYSVNATTKAETSKITIPYEPTVYGKMSKKYVQFAFDVDFFGIVATVTADCEEVSEWVEYKAPGAQLVAGRLSPYFKGAQKFIPALLTTKNDADNYVTKPDNSFELDANGEKIIDWYSTYVVLGTAPSAYVYPTNVFDFNDYVTIKNIPTTDYSKYQVRISAKPIENVNYKKTTVGTTTTYTQLGTSPKFVFGATAVESFVLNTEVNTDKDFAAHGKDLNASNGAQYGNARYWMTTLDAIENGNVKLDWTDSKATKCEVKVELVEAGHALDSVLTGKIPCIGTPLSIEFKTDAVIKSVDATTVEVKWTPETPAVSANVAAGLTVTDLFDAPIYNVGYNRAINTFWSSYEYDPTETAKAKTAAYNESLTPAYKTATTPDQYFKIYNQTIEVVEFDDPSDEATDKVWITNNGGFDVEILTAVGATPTEDVSFNTATGELRFTSTAAPVNNVTFTVHVAVSHKNDNATPIEKTVNIVVKK